ncbi:MAG: exodeoxyribonuclease VII large subunit, partial [Pseudomonadota bacterium]
MTVTTLNRQARIALEERLQLVWVTGELSNFARPRSGHWYFTLKDDKAQVRCAMFA